MQDTSFYDKLCQTLDLDMRDIRGKRHNMAFVLMQLTLSLLSGRDGCMSSLHRHMSNHYESLCLFLGVDKEAVISRSHLPILLQKVNLGVFERLLFSCYGLSLSQQERQWFAGDGKELRGSIEKGNKRGENIVQLVAHSDRSAVAQTYYDGRKESEKTCIRSLLSLPQIGQQNITLDALHFCPQTLEIMADAGGAFVVGLKKNQPELLAQMTKASTFLKAGNEHITIQKGHGRIDIRRYWTYNVSNEYFDKRWDKCHFCILIKIERERSFLKTKLSTIETAFYLSNAPLVEKNTEIYDAIRQHWAIEVSNYIRDVSLKEDQLRTKKRLFPKLYLPLEH